MPTIGCPRVPALGLPALSPGRATKRLRTCFGPWHISEACSHVQQKGPRPRITDASCPVRGCERGYEVGPKPVSPVPARRRASTCLAPQGHWPSGRWSSSRSSQWRTRSRTVSGPTDLRVVSNLRIPRRGPLSLVSGRALSLQETGSQLQRTCYGLPLSHIFGSPFPALPTSVL